MPFPVNSRKRLYLAVSIPRDKYRSPLIVRSHGGGEGLGRRRSETRPSREPRIFSNCFASVTIDMADKRSVHVFASSYTARHHTSPDTLAKWVFILREGHREQTTSSLLVLLVDPLEDYLLPRPCLLLLCLYMLWRYNASDFHVSIFSFGRIHSRRMFLIDQ